MKLTVNLDEHSYPIYIENNILGNSGVYISKIFKGRRIMIVSDDRVFPLYGEILLSSLREFYECHSLVLPHGESTKSFQSLPLIYSAMLKAKITRSDLIIALGGGVIGDLAGFAAASYLRGIKYIQVPTSLLAQVDSSVGGKVAVDLPEGKNLVGAFYQPSMVLIDPTVLATLPERFVNDGMGEVIKYGCIKDNNLFELLEQCASFDKLKNVMPSVIERCVDIKRQIVERDQFDTGERMLLNFGHTLAHAIEKHCNYERESHGEAVAIGMYQLSHMAEEKGLTAAGTADRILRLLKAYGLPYESGFTLGELMESITLDKKHLDGKLNLVLLKKIGESYIYPTNVDNFEDKKMEL